MCERSGLIIPNLVVKEEKKRKSRKGGEPTVVKLFFTELARAHCLLLPQGSSAEGGGARLSGSKSLLYDDNIVNRYVSPPPTPAGLDICVLVELIRVSCFFRVYFHTTSFSLPRIPTMIL